MCTVAFVQAALLPWSGGVTCVCTGELVRFPWFKSHDARRSPVVDMRAVGGRLLALHDATFSMDGGAPLLPHWREGLRECLAAIRASRPVE